MSDARIMVFVIVFAFGVSIHSGVRILVGITHA